MIGEMIIPSVLWSKPSLVEGALTGGSNFLSVADDPKLQGATGVPS